MPAPDPFRLDYAPALDGLRGVAIIAVMLFHAEIIFFSGGFVGVDVFFVLSGFLITSLLIQEYDRAGFINLKHFYMRRLLRLGPALIFLLICFVVISYLFVDKEKAAKNYVDALVSLLYFSNWARAFNFYPPDFLGHTWSLSIEEQFYILWPVVLLTLLRTIKNRWYIFFFSTMVALASWVLRVYFTMADVSVERLYNGLDTRADALMIGCALGVLVSSRLLNKQNETCLAKWLSYISAFSMLCFLSALHLGEWQDRSMYYIGFVVIEFIAAIFILDVMINRTSLIGKILAMRGVVWVGSISYGLYLWHYPIYRTMFELGFNRWTVVLAGTLMTFTVAACSYYFLERPMLKFRRFFTCPPVSCMNRKDSRIAQMK